VRYFTAINKYKLADYYGNWLKIKKRVKFWEKAVTVITQKSQSTALLSYANERSGAGSHCGAFTGGGISVATNMSFTSEIRACSHSECASQPAFTSMRCMHRLTCMVIMILRQHAVFFKFLSYCTTSSCCQRSVFSLGSIQ
jgi:hypothetical protein